MPISLTKGGNINLSKEAPGLSKITLGLGWGKRVTAGTEFDLDASAFLITEAGKVRSDADFIFYKQTTSTCGSVQHSGDNRTGEGSGDDEKVHVDLSKIPADVQKVVFTVTIYDFQSRRQNFGMVSDAYIRIFDQEQSVVDPLSGERVFKEIARYDLSEEASNVTAMIFGELYRHNGEWKFRAVGQGYNGGLRAMCGQYGISI